MLTTVKTKASISEIQRVQEMLGLSRALKILHEINEITVAILALVILRTAKTEN